MNQAKAKWSWTNNVGGGDFLVYEDRLAVASTSRGFARGIPVTGPT